MSWDNRIGRRLKLQDLHLLLAVAEAGSMGRAAQRLNTTQPSVSRAIADLEHALGAPLFDRTTQGVEPTPQGRALLRATAAAFDSLRQGIGEIAALDDPGAGALRIGGNESIIAGLLPPVIDALRRRYPRIAVQVTLVTGRVQQVAELRDRKLDLVIGRLDGNSEPDIESQPLYEEPTCVVAGAGSRWSRRRRPILFQELIDEPWALPLPGTLVGALFADAFRAAGAPYPPRCAVTGNIHIHCALVAGGDFLAILPRSTVQLAASRLGLRVLPVVSPVPPSPIGILRLRDRALPPIVAHFLAETRTVIETLREGGASGPGRDAAPDGAEGARSCNGHHRPVPPA